MPIPLNPYVAGNPVGDHETFVGRADILRAVDRILQNVNANGLVLYGQRRIGKTSILQYLTHQLPKNGPYQTIYFDLQDKAALPLEDVLKKLAQRIALNLKLTPFGKWSDETDFRSYFKEVFIPKVFSTLPQEHSLVLLFDEFDVLDNPDTSLAAVELFPYLRELLSLDPARLQFVFVIGRNLDDLTNRALPLLKGLSVHRVSQLKKTHTEELVRLSEKNQTLYWSDTAIERVWYWTHGHPYLTQQLCWVTWESAYEDDLDTPVTITPEDVDAAIEDTLEHSLAALEWLWDGLGPAERVVASALAQAGPGSISLDQLESVLRDSGVRVLIGELQNAPETLEKWDLLEKKIGQYRFRVELLRLWLLKRKPLAQVQDELDRIQPVAESLFQAASGLYRSGELGGAGDLLRQALGINPNHFKASHLLAELLLANMEFDEAITVLRRLCEFRPATARPRLIQALLSKADTVPKENYDEFEEVLQMEPSTHEPFSLYQEVLTLDSDNRQAKLGLIGFWELRGDGMMRLKSPNQAIDAYQKAVAYLEAQESGTLSERWKNLMKKLGAAYVALAQILESEKAYPQALEVYHTLRTKFGILGESWDDDIRRLTQKSQIDVTYNRAIKAIVNEKKKLAIGLLQDVVALEPTYGRAAHYLSEMVEKGTARVTEDVVLGDEETLGELDMRGQPRLLRVFAKLANSGTLTWLPMIMITMGMGVEILNGVRFGYWHPYLYAFTPLLLAGWGLTARYGQRAGIRPFLRSVTITFVIMFVMGVIFATSLIPVAKSFLPAPNGVEFFGRGSDLVVVWVLLAVLLATSFVNLLSTQSYNVAKGVVMGVSSGLSASLMIIVAMAVPDTWTGWLFGFLFLGMMNTAFGSSNLRDDRNGLYALFIQAVLIYVGIFSIFGYFWQQLPWGSWLVYTAIPLGLTTLMLLKGASMRGQKWLKFIGVLLTILGFATTFWMVFLYGWQVIRDFSIQYF